MGSVAPKPVGGGHPTVFDERGHVELEEVVCAQPDQGTPNASRPRGTDRPRSKMRLRIERREKRCEGWSPQSERQDWWETRRPEGP
jgi:hypothetical protein